MILPPDVLVLTSEGLGSTSGRDLGVTDVIRFSETVETRLGVSAGDTVGVIRSGGNPVRGVVTEGMVADEVVETTDLANSATERAVSNLSEETREGIRNEVLREDKLQH